MQDLNKLKEEWLTDVERLAQLLKPLALDFKNLNNYQAAYSLINEIKEAVSKGGHIDHIKRLKVGAYACIALRDLKELLKYKRYKVLELIKKYRAKERIEF